MSASRTNEEAGLRVEGLRYSSEGFDLGPVDFRLEPGEILAVFGPNGAGKSTLLRMLAGLEPTVGGRILLDGRDITQVPSHRRGVGMVFQDLALFPQLTVGENIAYGPRTRRWPEDQVTARVNQLLTDLQLERFADRLPTSLSGGEQQRVALARALAPRPRLLLFDEPLSSADRDIRSALQQEIRTRVETDRLLAVYVTHDLDEGTALATRMGFLRAGHWVLEGSAAEVRRSPRSRFVAEFLGFNVRHLERGWVATDPSRTELVIRGAPESLPGTVRSLRVDGELVHVDVDLPGEGSRHGAVVRCVQWGLRFPVEVGTPVGLRFQDEIPLPDE